MFVQGSIRCAVIVIQIAMFFTPFNFEKFKETLKDQDLAIAAQFQEMHLVAQKKAEGPRK